MSALEAVDGYEWEASGKRAADLMRKSYYPQLLSLGFEDIGALVPVEVGFDLSNPLIQKTLSGLAKNITGIADTTRDDIRALVSRQADEGWSNAELAKRIREQGEINSKSRSIMIARSESAMAYNQGGVLACREAGVEKVEVVDGDEDEDCASVNGEIWSLDKAADNPIAHPNCTRTFIPVVEE